MLPAGLFLGPSRCSLSCDDTVWACNGLLLGGGEARHATGEWARLLHPRTVCDHVCYYSHEIFCVIERKLLLFVVLELNDQDFKWLKRF